MRFRTHRRDRRGAPGTGEARFFFLPGPPLPGKTAFFSLRGPCDGLRAEVIFYIKVENIQKGDAGGFFAPAAGMSGGDIRREYREKGRDVGEKGGGHAVRRTFPPGRVFFLKQRSRMVAHAAL